MYRIAFDAYKKNFGILIFFAALCAIVEMVLPGSYAVAGFVIAIYVAFLAHQTILGAPSAVSLLSHGKGKHVPNLGFILRYLFFCVLAITLIAGSIFGPILLGNEFLQIPFIVFFIPYASVFSLFGSVLPASSIRQDARFFTAFQLGKRTFWKTLWRFSYGALLFLFTPIVLNLMLFLAIPDYNGQPNSTNSWALNGIMGGVWMLSIFFALFLVAANLCITYKSENTIPLDI